MSLVLPRRLRALATIDTAPAPVLSGHVDVDAEPPAASWPLGVVDVDPVVEPIDFHPDTLLEAAPDLVVHRPPVDRGVCYHHAHVDVPDRGRVGLLVDGDAASLLPCPYRNRDGR